MTDHERQVRSQAGDQIQLNSKVTMEEAERLYKQFEIEVESVLQRQGISALEATSDQLIDALKFGLCNIVCKERSSPQVECRDLDTDELEALFDQFHNDVDEWYRQQDLVYREATPEELTKAAIYGLSKLIERERAKYESDERGYA